MSDRSRAWYEAPGNAERRRVKMRLYGQALVSLGRRYPAERRSAYRKAKREGLASSAAQNKANRELREAHPEEFREIYEGLLDQEPEPEEGKDA